MGLKSTPRPQSTLFDGTEQRWYHTPCFFKQTARSAPSPCTSPPCASTPSHIGPRRAAARLDLAAPPPSRAPSQVPFTLADVAGFDKLRWPDQEALRAKVASFGGSGSLLNGETYRVEVAPSSRAQCRGCATKVLKGEVRIGKEVEAAADSVWKGRAMAWHHPPCFALRGWWAGGCAALPGWGELSTADQAATLALCGEAPAAARPLPRCTPAPMCSMAGIWPISPA